MSKGEALSQEFLRVVERSYCYKVISMIFSPKMLGSSLREVRSALRKTTDSLSPETVRLISAAETIYSSGWMEKLSEAMGEMKKLEPLERKLVPGVSMGVVLADIVGFYKAFGLRPNEGIPVDHFSVEAEFMSHLLLREAYALANNNDEMKEIVVDAERKFLRDHLSRMMYYVKALREELLLSDELMQAVEEFMDKEHSRLGLHKSEMGSLKIHEAPRDAVKCPFA